MLGHYLSAPRSTLKHAYEFHQLSFRTYNFLGTEK